jgi:DNA-binding transcriptional regulator YdaS (Cro superfamily)
MDPLTTATSSIETLIQHCGSVSSAARALNVPANVVTNWRTRGYIPPARALAVERVTGGRVSPVEVLREAEAAEMDRKGGMRA